MPHGGAALQPRATTPRWTRSALVPDAPGRAALRQNSSPSTPTAKRGALFSWKRPWAFCLHLGEEVLLVLCERDDLSACRPQPPLFDHGQSQPFTPPWRFLQQPRRLGGQLHRRTRRRELSAARLHLSCSIRENSSCAARLGCKIHQQRRLPSAASCSSRRSTPIAAAALAHAPNRAQVNGPR